MQHKKKVQNKCRLIVLQLNLIILVLKNVQNFIKSLVGTLMCACTTSPKDKIAYETLVGHSEQ